MTPFKLILLTAILIATQSSFAYESQPAFFPKLVSQQISTHQHPENLSDALLFGTPDHVLIMLEGGESANSLMKNGSIPALHYSLFKADLESATYLIKFGADIYKENVHGQTVLEMVTEQQSGVLLDFVLENSQLSRWQKLLSEKQSVLHRAIRSRKKVQVDILLNHGWDVNEKNKHGDTPLMLTVQNNDVGLTKLLIKRNADLYAKNNSGKDALYYSLNAKSMDMLNVLIHAGINVERRYKNKRTPLMIAINNGNLAAVKLLLRGFGSNVHAVNNEGENALVMALKRRKKRVAMMEELLKKGADANSYDENGQSVLSIALSYRCYICVDLLLASGANVNDGGKHRVPGLDSLARPPLYWAIQKQDAYLFNKLIQAGADVNKVHSNDQTTPVFAAVKFGNSNAEMLRLLIKHGAKINIRDKDYWTPLLNASSSADIEVLDVLLKAGADVNQGNWHGWTPLMAAAQAGDSAKVRLLLEHGASVNAQTRRGWTALSDAKRHGQFDVVRILQQAGGLDPANVSPKTRKDRGNLKLEIKVMDK